MERILNNANVHIYRTLSNNSISNHYNITDPGLKRTSLNHNNTIELGSLNTDSLQESGKSSPDTTVLTSNNALK